MLMVSTLVAMPSAPKHEATALCDVSCDQLTEEERRGPGLSMLLHYLQAPTRSGQLQHYSLLLRQP